MRPMVPVAIIVLFIATVIYVLGAGPAAWMMNSGRASECVSDAVEMLYLPLALVAASNEKLEDLLDAYIELWWVPPAPPPLIQGNLTVIPAPATSAPADTIPQVR